MLSGLHMNPYVEYINHFYRPFVQKLFCDVGYRRLKGKKKTLTFTQRLMAF